MSLIHGGDLQAASEHFGWPINDWIDLSTGINLHSYPVPTMAAEVWQRLPYLQESLVQAAQDYYGCPHILLSAGSQPVIERLPKILHQHGNNLTALLPDIGYQEHQQAWRSQGTVATYSGLNSASSDIDTLLQQPHIGHLLLINPNNPTGITYSPTQVITWAKQLAAKQGFVIVDEAFIDCLPDDSIVSINMPSNVVVLRSFGKFFGLAGVRLGAMLASPEILKTMAASMGPWRINGPAQAIATAAYQDLSWQQNMRQTLQQEQTQQLALWHSALIKIGAQLQADTPLFRSFSMPKSIADELHTQAGKVGILLRPVPVTNTSSLLRLGNINLTNQPHLDRCQAWLASLANNIG